MPLTTASKRSGGGGIDSVNRPASSSVSGTGAASQGARVGVMPRSGSASSSGSGIIRARPNPIRRETASTSTVRPKMASHSSSTASTSQSVHSPVSILQSIPYPSFPPSDAFDQALDGSLVYARLLQLARYYLQQHDQSDKITIYDLQSASLYARLALQTDPTSVPARRLVALTLLQGAQPFPFGPSTIHSSSLSLSSQSTTPISSSSISGAYAAIEVLKDGNEDVFVDVGCARIYAKACSIVGKTREGKEAMAWTLKNASEKKQSKSFFSSQSHGQSSSMTAQPPKLFSIGAEEAVVYNDLAQMDSKTNQFKEAAVNYSKAKRLDPWSWTAWVGLCDVGSEESLGNMFCGESHKPSTFYADLLESQLMNHHIDAEVVRKTIEDLKARGPEYYNNGAMAGRDEDNTTLSQSLQRTTVTGTANMMRKAVGNTTTGTSSIIATPSFARAGTRTENAVTTTAGIKRVRTTTANSGIGGSVNRLGQGVNQHSINNGNASADTHANKRPAISGFRARGPIAASQQTATHNARVGGTLSAVRTNEQQRPNSSASGSSRGASDKDILKPRRSARVNTATIDIAQEQPLANQKSSIASRPATGTGQTRRPLSKPATVSNGATETETGPRKAMTVNKSAPADTQGGSKILVTAMETSVFESARQAAVWNAVDKRVKELLQTLAMAYFAVKNLQSKSAIILLRRKRTLSSAEKAELKREIGKSSSSIDTYTGLDDCYRNTIDVQCLLARAYHDMASYHLAEKHFVHAKRLSPSLDNHMDIYSLTLFHLQREVQLSRLARELNQLDANSSVSHIVKGNAFALQREHSLALQSFQRACLAAPNCAYAFTLAGYEAHELGFKDKSIRYFRQAINIDKRHWNAFAGLARVYVESERHDSAEYYYRRAIDIHETNPVLWDVYGSVLSSQEKLEEAQEAFGQAIRLDPTLAMSHIKLAEILLLQSRTAPEKRVKAHNHLLEAVKHAPEEAHVHLMLAHTYMELGKGSFARIDQGGKRRRTSNASAVQEILLPSELQQLGANGVSGPSSTSRAIGNSIIPNAYQAEIAKYLCAAIDLDPKYVRFVKAMGEGAKAALRGIVSRFMMDANGGVDGSTLLIDSTSAAMEGQTVDSMVDLEGDQVLEDATAMTEELNSDDEQEETGDGEEGEEDDVDDGEDQDEEDEHHEDHIEGMDDGESEGDIIEDEMTADDLENEIDIHGGHARHVIDQSDISMSF